jgi:hypothetical protein
MTDDAKAPERVTFSRGYAVCMMGIDGTWRRDCLLNTISDNDAVLTAEGLDSSSGRAGSQCCTLSPVWEHLNMMWRPMPSVCQRASVTKTP